VRCVGLLSRRLPTPKAREDLLKFARVNVHVLDHTAVEQGSGHTASLELCLGFVELMQNHTLDATEPVAHIRNVIERRSSCLPHPATVAPFCVACHHGKAASGAETPQGEFTAPGVPNSGP